MPRGTLEVILVSAEDLSGNNFLIELPVFIGEKTLFSLLGKMDPYVILTYRAQEHKSSVAKDAGSNPHWNESFLFTVSDNVSELNLRIMDERTLVKDDFLGETRIFIEPAFVEGSIPETCYSVVKEQDCCGLVKVAITFYPEW